MTSDTTEQLPFPVRVRLLRQEAEDADRARGPHLGMTPDERIAALAARREVNEKDTGWRNVMREMDGWLTTAS